MTAAFRFYLIRQHLIIEIIVSHNPSHRIKSLFAQSNLILINSLSVAGKSIWYGSLSIGQASEIKERTRLCLRTIICSNRKLKDGNKAKKARYFSFQLLVENVVALGNQACNGTDKAKRFDFRNVFACESRLFCFNWFGYK